MSDIRTAPPTGRAILEVWEKGLSCIRPFKPAGGADTSAIETEWNFGPCFPPSYQAFGRMRALLAAIQTSQMAGHRVLEVAAGDGSLATGLAAQGREVYANDLRAEHLQAALSQLQDGAKVKVIAGDVFAADPASLGRFDLVVACEVIEHVAHPDQFLAKLRALLAPDGLLFLTTPNGRYFRNRLPNFSDVGDAGKLEEFQFRPDANGHLFLLTANELTGMAQPAGLTPMSVYYSGSPFVTGHAGFRLLRKLHLRRPFLAAENALLSLPESLQQRLCFSMTAIFRATTTVTHEGVQQ